MPHLETIPFERSALLNLADNIEASLWRDLLSPWFPTCVDPDGGFFEEFSEDWSCMDCGIRNVVFQSRMTWVAATVAEAFPDRAEEYLAYARHGLRFLSQRMVDPGGCLYWAVDLNGRPVGDYARQRQSYGIAFGIYALAAVYRVTGEKTSLDLAIQLFRWLEVHLHDSEHMGYYECADEFGHPMFDGTKSIAARPGDAIGTPFGLKSQNAHLHLLEAFTELAKVWADPLLLNRLRELHSILVHRLYHPDGWLHVLAQSDWTPVEGLISHGHDIEAAHLLLDSAQTWDGNIGEETASICDSLADYVLQYGFDEERGGIFYAGDAEGTVQDRTKIWWAEAEALLGFAKVLELPAVNVALYWQAITKTWSWISNHQIDAIHRGWINSIEDDGTEPLPAKGDPWKAAYHDGRSLIFTARTLRRIADSITS